MGLNRAVAAARGASRRTVARKSTFVRGALSPYRAGCSIHPDPDRVGARFTPILMYDAVLTDHPSDSSSSATSARPVARVVLEQERQDVDEVLVHLWTQNSLASRRGCTAARPCSSTRPARAATWRRGARSGRRAAALLADGRLPPATIGADGLGARAVKACSEPITPEGRSAPPSEVPLPWT